MLEKNYKITIKSQSNDIIVIEDITREDADTAISIVQKHACFVVQKSMFDISMNCSDLYISLSDILHELLDKGFVNKVGTSKVFTRY